MRQNVLDLGMTQLIGAHNNDDIGNKMIYFARSKQKIKFKCVSIWVSDGECVSSSV